VGISDEALCVESSLCLMRCLLQSTGLAVSQTAVEQTSEHLNTTRTP